MTDEEKQHIANAESMTTAHRLACAVLMFHGGGTWSDHERDIWHALTGEREATTRTLCDLARRTLKDE